MAYSTNDVIEYQIRFFNVNPIPLGGAIKLTMPGTITPLEYCIPSYGIEDETETNNVLCNFANYPILLITRFALIRRNTLLEVRVKATNPAGTGLIPSNVAITTYNDAAAT
jgi:hypothetical protein